MNPSFKNLDTEFTQLDSDARRDETPLSNQVDEEARASEESPMGGPPPEEEEPQPSDFHGWASYLETIELVRAETRARERLARQQCRWSWETEDGKYPLDELLGGAVNLKVLRVLWSGGGEHVGWPTEIAPKARLSRTSVHAALARFEKRHIVERVAVSHDSRSFAYQLDRRNPVVRELMKLFHMEAGLRGGWLRG